MPAITFSPTNQALFQEQIENIRRRFDGDIVSIRYSLGKDLIGEPVIRFRVMLADAVGDDDERLWAVGSAVRDAIRDEVDFDPSDHVPIFSFRTVSEQAELQDPEWD